METTTIYTKVAVIRQQQVQSPLDMLTGKPHPPRREPRPRWVTLEIPPLEAWQKPLSWLRPEQRERIASTDFYQLLQREITRRYLALKRPAG